MFIDEGINDHQLSYRVSFLSKTSTFINRPLDNDFCSIPIGPQAGIGHSSLHSTPQSPINILYSLNMSFIRIQKEHHVANYTR